MKHVWFFCCLSLFFSSIFAAQDLRAENSSDSLNLPPAELPMAQRPLPDLRNPMKSIANAYSSLIHVLASQPETNGFWQHYSKHQNRHIDRTFYKVISLWTGVSTSTIGTILTISGIRTVSKPFQRIGIASLLLGTSSSSWGFFTKPSPGDEAKFIRESMRPSNIESIAQEIMDYWHDLVSTLPETKQNELRLRLQNTIILTLEESQSHSLDLDNLKVMSSLRDRIVFEGQLFFSTDAIRQFERSQKSSMEFLAGFTESERVEMEKAFENPTVELLKTHTEALRKLVVTASQVPELMNSKNPLVNQAMQNAAEANNQSVRIQKIYRDIAALKAMEAELEADRH